MKKILYISYFVILNLFIVILIYWRIFGVDFIDNPVNGLFQNYPFWAGILCIFLGPIFIHGNYKRYKKEPSAYASFYFVLSVLVIPIGFYFIYMGL